MGSSTLTRKNKAWPYCSTTHHTINITTSDTFHTYVGGGP